MALGGGGTVRLSRQDYSFTKAAHKPTQMALRLADKLFTRETLLKSTVHGTKEFAPLDQVVIAAIKGKFVTYKLVNNKSCYCDIALDSIQSDFLYQTQYYRVRY